MLPTTVTKPFFVEYKFYKFEVTPVSRIREDLYSFAVNIIIKDDDVSVSHVMKNVHSWLCQNSKMDLIAVEFDFYSEFILTVKIDAKYMNLFIIEKMIESISGLIMKLKYN